MEVKAMAEELGSWVRSGIIASDLPRVVEELVFNSLDAGSSKVTVFVGVGASCIRVVDDGCGISRDDLVLLGQRYATSKIHPTACPDPFSSKSFGSRGEALASISDVSLLEIFTRTSGTPNGYRKVLKGSKCLYLGIDDEQKEVGTAVVVHDLFYNQPVRRKCMQGSPKKVLQSVKNCLLRIALVHSKVFFKVFDSESDEELLSTNHSSAFSLLINGFGIKDSSFLHQLNFVDGVLKISGYVSGPCDCLSLKAFQYVYINTRFVCKGPIHKLLNLLANKFECLDAWKADHGSHKGKRSRLQANPSYILNLSCPSSLYSLTFEMSKTCVEFKDWIPILNFTETAIQQIWKNLPDAVGKSVGAQTCEKKDIMKAKENSTSIEEGHKNCNTQNYPSREISSSSLETPSERAHPVLSRKQDQVSVQDFDIHLLPCKEQVACMKPCLSDDDMIWIDPFSKYMCTSYPQSTRNLLTMHGNFSCEDDCCLDDIFTTGKEYASEVGVGISRSYNEHESSIVRNSASHNIFSLHSPEIDVDNNSHGSFLQRCSSRSFIPFDSAIFPSDEGLDFLRGDFKTKRQRVSSHEDGYNGITEIYDRIPTSDFQKNVSSHVSDINLSEASDELFSFDRERFAAEKYVLCDSVVRKRSYGPENIFSGSMFPVATSDPLFQAVSWEAEYFSDTCMNSVMEDPIGKSPNHVFSDVKGPKCKMGCEIFSRNVSRDNCIDYLLASDKFDHLGYDYCTLSDRCAPLSNMSSTNSRRSIDDQKSNWLHSGFHSQFQENSLKFEGQNVVEYASLQHEEVSRRKPRRSHSAPPFCKQKRRFIALINPSVIIPGENESELLDDAPLPPERDGLQHLHIQPDHVADLVVQSRSYENHDPIVMPDVKGVRSSGASRHMEQPVIPNSSVQGIMQNEIPEPKDPGTKWRNGSIQIRHYSTAKADAQDAILDISSGFLHLASSSLVPRSLTKNFLEDAKVLQQVDKKFIPVVAGGTLAVIDQHAADERIRLEELHEKILTGEAKTITYLDAEQQLMLPEIGHQLLHDYGKQIREWGWICNIEAPGSDSFNKSLNVLHQQEAVVTLLAVPCILGVNLSDGDLLEFLQQLADTDGSAYVPPSVHRLLNSKACRGAIMFGDTLLLSECALIVEELKKTSLYFQCAHGRPTTAPLVDLEALHQQIARHGVSHTGSRQSWHGLHRQDLSFKRAAQRLSAARS